MLAAYALGVVGWATVKLFASGFYALRDTRTPVVTAASSVVIAVILSYILMRRIGPAGIGLGASIGALYNTTMQLVLLQRRIGRVVRREQWRAAGLAALASAVAAAGGVGESRERRLDGGGRGDHGRGRRAAAWTSARASGWPSASVVAA